MTKTCSKCRLEKDHGEFGNQSAAKDGLQYYCKVCHREDRKISHLNNKNHDKEYNKVYYLTNKKIINQKCKDYYKNNSDSRRTASNTYRKENPKKVKDSLKLWATNNLGHIAAYNSGRRARKLNQTPLWSETLLIKELYKKAARLSKSTGIKYEVDHIFPLNSPSGSGLHCISNLRIITKTENSSKSNKWPYNVEINGDKIEPTFR